MGQTGSSSQEICSPQDAKNTNDKDVKNDIAKADDKNVPEIIIHRQNETHEVLCIEERENMQSIAKHWALQINRTTMNSLENYFKVFAISDSADLHTTPMHPRITFTNVACELVESTSKNKLIIYLDSKVEKDLLVLKCLHEIELSISNLCKVHANIILDCKKKPYTHCVKILFPSKNGEIHVDYDTIFNATIYTTLIRCDWIYQAVLPRLVLTSITNL